MKKTIFGKDKCREENKSEPRDRLCLEVCLLRSTGGGGEQRGGDT